MNSAMQQAMSSPMMQQMLDNPEVLRSLMQANPQMRQVRCSLLPCRKKPSSKQGHMVSTCSLAIANLCNRPGTQFL